MSEWITDWGRARFGDFVSVEHGWPFRSEHYSSEPEQPVVVAIGNFDYSGGFRFERSSVKHYSGEYPPEYELAPGDLLMVMTCQTEGGEILGVPGIVPNDGRTYLHNQRIGKVVFSESAGLDRDFSFRLAQTKSFNRQLFVTASGSKILHTSPKRIESVEIPVPPVSEQRAIAEVLGALDDKIAANASLTGLLDETVRTEYAAVAIGSRVTIGDLFTLRKENVAPDGIAPSSVYVGLEHVDQRNLWLHRSGLGVEVSSQKSSFAAGDVLFGKLRPYFHKIVLANCDGVASTDILVLTPQNPGLRGMALAAVAQDAVVSEVTAASQGTRMPRTNWAQLSAVEVPWSDDNAAVRATSERIEASSRAAYSLIEENRTLAATRDALLPQLMSGKLRVKDAEQHVSEVV